MVKVLVADDSALMRKYLKEILSKRRGVEVVTARDGNETLQVVISEDPDVITLDINMPVMDGLTCLSHIMTDHPRPVVMISSLTREGELATFEALAMGAVDFVCKPGGTISANLDAVADEIRRKVLGVARARFRSRHGARQKSASASRITPPAATKTAGAPRRAGGIRPLSDRHGRATSESSSPSPRAPAATRVTTAKGPRLVGPFKVVLVGSSTGGPQALDAIIPALSASFPVPVVVAQHMPAAFTSVFAQRLDRCSLVTVEEVSSMRRMRPGHVYVGRGDADVAVMPGSEGPVVCSKSMDEARNWHPSVGGLVASAMATFSPREILAVQLTGMGDDGATELTRLHEQGGRVLAEDEATAVIYGMPRAVIEAGAADEVVRLEDVASRISTLLNVI